jgi:transposase
MLKDPQTLRCKVARTHRTYSPQFKAELAAMSRQPGVSIAALALQHGINANLLHRWRKEWSQGFHRLEPDPASVVTAMDGATFVAVPLQLVNILRRLFPFIQFGD